MAPSTATDVDGSEDVNDFLLRIRELGEKRDKEDEERTKKLEDEILQGRKERQARRAERAQSISPSKDSPLSERLSPAFSHSAIDPPEQFGPSSRTSGSESPSPSRSIHDREGRQNSLTAEEGSPVSRSHTFEMKPSSPQNQIPRTSAVRRSGTLSWQQRPTSRDFNNNDNNNNTDRPAFPNFSRVGRLRNTSVTSNDDYEPSRSQVASSLASKDPSWLRQTADRKIGSPALRKDAEVTGSDVTALNKNQPLPGMDNDKRESTTTDPDKPIGQDVGPERSATPSRASSTFGDGGLHNRYSSISSASILGSPNPVSSVKKLEPRQSEPAPDDQPVSPSFQRRLSPDRTASSTKGLGGFVQSAMMKRSDSVSKRWSAQVSPRHSRANSVAGNRNSVAVSSLGDLPSSSTAGRKSTHDASSSITSRPGSSHSEATVVHHNNNTKGSEQSATPLVPDNNNNNNINNAPSSDISTTRLRSNSVLSKDDQDAESKPQTPTSPFPSRTMDPKRWSPTKSTWLESALNRPDLSRQKPIQQPPWVRERQSRGSVDLGRSGSSKEATQSPATGNHIKKQSFSGFSGVSGTSDKNKSKEKNPDSGPSLNEKSSNPYSTEKATDAPEDIEEKSQKEPKLESPPGETAENKRPAPAPSVAPKPNISVSTLPLRDPISTRPKPQSPVLDFRGNLRRREAPKDDSPKEEPEFKNIFGKLRKAETSNYVPEDKFKDNILKGKAALNATGGPRSTPRIDELKDSILKQKEAMKTGGGPLKRNPAEERENKSTVPEALAKRNKLSKASNVKDNQTADDHLSSPSSETLKSPVAVLGNKAFSPVGSEGTVSPSSPAVREADESDSAPKVRSTVSPERREIGKGESSPLAARPKEKRDVEAKEEEKVARETTKSVRPSPLGNALQDIPAATTTESPVAKGKLAGRINPALAGLLSRGPPPAGAGSNSSSKGTSSETPQQSTDSRPPGTLTHMTKSRARGPKRRLPKAATTIESTVPPQKDVSGLSSDRKSPPLEIKKLRTAPAATEDVSTLPTPGSKFEETPPKPRLSSKPIGLRSRSQGTQDNNADNEPRSVPTSGTAIDDVSSSQPGIQDVVNVKEDAPSKPVRGAKPAMPFSASVSTQRQSLQASTNVESGGQLKGTTAAFNLGLGKGSPKRVAGVSRREENGEGDSPESNKPTLPPKPSKSPSPFSVSKQSPQTPSSPSSSIRTNMKENGIDSPLSFKQKPVPGPQKGELRDISSPLDKTLPFPPVGSSKSDVSNSQSSTPPRPPPKASSLSAVPRTSEAEEIITSFFKTFPKSSLRAEIDPQLFLESKLHDQKIRTLKKQIWEITGDGKRQDLPVNQEYILYEGSMYLCVHSFEGDGGARTEAHLWCGDDVGEAALEDAQLFARKIARENGCKLELIRQGKETGHFIQALGGIILTRRGHSSRSSSSALYMLCGRKHLKQMAFDEVDMSRHSLCSGYPFVISARFGKLYLWKGKGSGAEEIGAARLIGMDLGLTGDFEEVTEGEEPEGFFENFPDNRDTEDYMRSDYWRLKPSHGHFHHRLLRLDHELGQRSGFWIRRSGSSSPVTRPNDTVQEIEPFCHKDLKAKDIYVLDTFFEIHVIVGEQASNRPGEFASAVVFAHEYGILAASLQDRPFIPKSFVSIGGVPDSCRSAFRKWDNRLWQAVPTLIPLNAAIEAIRC